jgi:hypothetical protein
VPAALMHAEKTDFLKFMSLLKPPVNWISAC